MPLVSVVIPVYNSQPTDIEIKSFKQCLKVLENYPISLVCPNGLDISSYQLIASNFQKQIIIERFDDYFFTNIQAYNRLMLSNKFYKRLIKYRYILIYQLDAWVFRDELDHWCSQEYDFIGAPWFNEYANATSNSFMIGIGNGGFSLRKVSTAIRILSSFKRIEPLRTIWNSRSYKATNIIGKIYLLKYMILAIFYFKNNTFHSFNDFGWNEDYFWSSKAASLFDWYKIPSSEIAMHFSFEVKPEKLYNLTNSQLPMGCHAFEKYNPEFWQRFITI